MLPWAATVLDAAMIHGLPLPLAQLARRVVNARDAVEEHHCTYYLAEAALKLGACARIAIARRLPSMARSALRRQLSALVQPSVGQWVALLRAADEELGERKALVGLPMQRQLGGLRGPVAFKEELRAFLDGLVEEEVIPQEQRRAWRRLGALAFFEALAAYRNGVMAHGSHRDGDFYRRQAQRMLTVLEPLLRSGLLLGELSLATPLGGQWRELSGLAGLPGPVSWGAPDEAHTEGTIFLVDDAHRVPLHPLMVVRDAGANRAEEVGVLNGSAWRRVDREEVEMLSLRRVDYLDYASGELVPEVDERRAFAAMLADIEDKALSEDGLSLLTGVPAGGLGAGQVVADKLEVLRFLGAGSMGRVYLVRHRELGRLEALKVLRSEVAEDPRNQSRFRREARAISQLSHPSIVGVHDFGRLPDGRHYLSMEYVEGESLEERLERDGALGPTESIELAIALAEAIAVAHEGGVLHRDLSPANLLLTSNGGSKPRLKVLDFGLAKFVGPSLAESRILTRGGEALGTVGFVAPELLRGEPGDERVDLYAAGCLLYLMLTGRPPYRANALASLRAEQEDAPPPPSALAAGPLPEGLETLVLLCLAREPAERPASARELADALRALGA